MNLNLKIKNKMNGSNSGDNILFLEVTQAYYASSEDYNHLHMWQIFNGVVDVIEGDHILFLEVLPAKSEYSSEDIEKCQNVFFFAFQTNLFF